MSTTGSPVVVVGAGPTGLLLAGELRLGGVEVTVLEQLPSPTGQSRAPGVYAGTLRIWEQRGLLDRFSEHLRYGAYGHFALLPGGIDLSGLDTSRAAGLIPQAIVEKVLAEWAVGLGAEVRRGHEVVGLRNGDDGVDLDVLGPGGRYGIRAGYVVGCDGGRSTVRRLAEFGFAGTGSTVEVMLADVAGLDAASLDLPRNPFPFLRNERGWVGLSSIMPDCLRVFVCDFATPAARSANPPGFAEVASAAADIAGIDITAGTPRWLSRFGNATRQVTTNRIGRVLVAGDAAHVHPPFGGQGLGAGAQDAVNLGWKLAAEVRGWAPPGLLDTYHEERHPAAARVLLLTQAQDALMQGGPAVTSLRNLITELTGLPAANRFLAEEVTGVNLRYDLEGPEHELLGRAVPPRELRVRGGAPTDTAAVLRPARGVLIELSGDTGIAEIGTRWRHRVDLVAAETTPGAFGTAAALLVRPDGHVAWAAPAESIDHHGLEKALWRWFGAPEHWEGRP